MSDFPTNGTNGVPPQGRWDKTTFQRRGQTTIPLGRQARPADGTPPVTPAQPANAPQAPPPTTPPPPAGPPQGAPGPAPQQEQTAPNASAPAEEGKAPWPEPPAPKRQPVDWGGVLRKWTQDARDDEAARRERGEGRSVPQRWMLEQPTSVADLWYRLRYERQERRDGRPGWGLNTSSDLVNGIDALIYVLHTVLIALPITLALYALAWLSQRRLRSAGLALVAYIVIANIKARTTG
ncbi:hypothetical protein AB0395_22010 [Streptosporangium sp. NPDC051023]|uniref:hypothetical protein n=1 Tax=Streptosporangium sp. NPDC051023 TaxID=3155410 RepID=UPI00344C505C